MACGMSLLPTPLLAAITSLACLTACSSPETLRQAESLRLPAVQGGFDLMATDVEGRRLFVNAEDNGTTEVIDLRTWTHLRTLGGMHEPKWAVYRPELAKLYVSNGDGLVKVFGSKTLAFDHEHRVNQVVCRECVFTYQVAGKRVAAQATRAAKGVGCGSNHAQNCA